MLGTTLYLRMWPQAQLYEQAGKLVGAPVYVLLEETSSFLANNIGWFGFMEEVIPSDPRYCIVPLLQG